MQPMYLMNSEVYFEEVDKMPLFTQLILFILLVLLSLADLKYRVAPAVEIFFFGCIWVAIMYQSQNLIQIGAVVFSVAYGALLFPTAFALPLLLWPPTWPSLLIGYGVRKEMMGKSDLFAIGGISALYSLDVAIIALIGTVLWTRWWSKKFGNKQGITLIPLLPGMVIGMTIGIGFHLLLKSFSWV